MRASGSDGDEGDGDEIDGEEGNSDRRDEDLNEDDLALEVMMEVLRDAMRKKLQSKKTTRIKDSEAGGGVESPRSPKSKHSKHRVAKVPLEYGDVESRIEYESPERHGRNWIDESLNSSISIGREESIYVNIGERSMDSVALEALSHLQDKSGWVKISPMCWMIFYRKSTN